MTHDLISLILLFLVLFVLIGLLIYLIVALQRARQWTQGWRQLSRLANLQVRGGAGRMLVSGMYRGRIVSIVATRPSTRSGPQISLRFAAAASYKPVAAPPPVRTMSGFMGVTLATNNRYNNRLLLKSQGISIASPQDVDALFEKGFHVESRSPEFASRLFDRPGVRLRLLPIATVKGASLGLSGEELTLNMPCILCQPEEMLDLLDILCDFTQAIESTPGAYLT